MAVVSPDGNTVVSKGEDTPSFDSIMDSALSELSVGAPSAPTQVPAETKVDPAPVTEPKSEPSAAAEDVVEFEGKQYKVEKSPRDYLLERLNREKGMRKAFSERDKVVKQLKDSEGDLTRYKQITDTFQKKGIEGLYDALAGKDGAYAEHLKKVEERAVKKYNATEDELRLIQQEELIERERALREMAEKTSKEVLENIQKKEMEAHREVLSNRLTEAFEGVSFEGKLGDEKREAKFNRYIWDQARVQLKEYAEAKGIAHHEIPSKVIKATFKELASDFEGSIKQEAAAVVGKQVQAASDAATLAAQARSTSQPVKDKASPLDALLDQHKGNAHSFINALFGKG